MPQHNDHLDEATRKLLGTSWSLYTEGEDDNTIADTLGDRTEKHISPKASEWKIYGGVSTISGPYRFDFKGKWRNHPDGRWVGLSGYSDQRVRGHRLMALMMRLVFKTGRHETHSSRIVVANKSPYFLEVNPSEFPSGAVMVYIQLMANDTNFKDNALHPTDPARVITSKLV